MREAQQPALPHKPVTRRLVGAGTGSPTGAIIDSGGAGDELIGRAKSRIPPA